MTPTPESLEQQQDFPERLAIASGPQEGLQHEQAEKVRRLLGPEVMEAPIVEDEPTLLPIRSASPEKQQVADEHATDDVEAILDDMQHLAQELVDLGTEHRVENWSDQWPIFANIRSHRLATREGRIIEQLQHGVGQLEQIVHEQHMFLDLGALREAVFGVKKPSGWKKALGTLLPSLRTFHRSVFVSRSEKIREAASDLSQQMRDSNRLAREVA